MFVDDNLMNWWPLSEPCYFLECPELSLQVDQVVDFLFVQREAFNSATVQNVRI